MFDIDLSLTRARDLIDFFLDDNSFEPKRLLDVSEKFVSGYLFRGQARRDWPLLPKAHRSVNALQNYTPQPPHLCSADGDDAQKYLKQHLHAEFRAVHLFLEAADHVGLQTPLDYSGLPGQLDIAAEFPDQRHLAATALAQHHGVPTRLLDWTESPLVAAYFAALKASSLTGDDLRENADFAVVCLGTQLLQTVTTIRVVSAPRAANPFLRAQRGAFTLITNANQFFVDNDRWPSIEDAVNAERKPTTVFCKPPLIRLSLPASEADALLRLLYRLDISQLTLMPTLDHAAECVAYKRTLWPSSQCF